VNPWKPGILIHYFRRPRSRPQTIPRNYLCFRLGRDRKKPGRTEFLDSSILQKYTGPRRIERSHKSPVALSLICVEISDQNQSHIDTSRTLKIPVGEKGSRP